MVCLCLRQEAWDWRSWLVGKPSKARLVAGRGRPAPSTSSTEPYPPGALDPKGLRHAEHCSALLRHRPPARSTCSVTGRTIRWRSWPMWTPSAMSRVDTWGHGLARRRGDRADVGRLVGWGSTVPTGGITLRDGPVEWWPWSWWISRWGCPPRRPTTSAPDGYRAFSGSSPFLP